MTIVGFHFSKIRAEKSDVIKGKVNINNNVAIENVEEKSLSLGNDKQKVIKFTFRFTSLYDPNVGSITLIGDVLYMDDAKQAKQIIDGWKKDKKLQKEIMTKVLNAILNKSNVQALILSDQVNLPPPIPLPKVNVSASPSKAKK